MEHRTTYLATVGTLGPMIGLVGTVYGMIMAFRVMRSRARRHRPAGSPPASLRLCSPPSRESPFRSRRSFLLDVPQSDRPAVARGGHGGRAAPRAVRPRSSRSGAWPSPPAQHPQPPMPMPMGGPPSHPHPFAVSARAGGRPERGKSPFGLTARSLGITMTGRQSQARISLTMFPCTSVSRKSRPAYR